MMTLVAVPFSNRLSLFRCHRSPTVTVENYTWGSPQSPLFPGDGHFRQYRAGS